MHARRLPGGILCFHESTVQPQQASLPCERSATTMSTAREDGTTRLFNMLTSGAIEALPAKTCQPCGLYSSSQSKMRNPGEREPFCLGLTRNSGSSCLHRHRREAGRDTENIRYLPASLYRWPNAISTRCDERMPGRTCYTTCTLPRRAKPRTMLKYYTVEYHLNKVSLHVRVEYEAKTGGQTRISKPGPLSTHGITLPRPLHDTLG
ncbi:hypothetical protein CONLIGDRAFT_637704 [Coniochaeta ligniaria NRRL 30616]|uniref:Uncharacterized protein n=1 Tax=Coniochaeta ligniaria NRRL 30616 TaxID=1408157 RepID=A0A1J7J6V6_9PEZI|nr:hypothetical protein CONLIGDRAFT_637704 [Coniochaeta ligniaria NRRL 30616]